MTEIVVPQPKMLPNGEPDVWPTLGPQVCDFLEDHMVYGPGPLKGEPYVVRDDLRYILYRAYEHFPDGYTLYGEDLSGRRAYNQVNLSFPKGSSKCLAPDTELMLKSGERVQAKDIRPGQEVMSYSDGAVVYRRVKAVEAQPMAMTYRVKTDHGRSIEVSEGHPFLVSGTQWREGMPKYHKYTANDPKAGKTSWSKVEDLAKGDRLVPALDWRQDRDDKASLGWLLGVFAGDASGDGRLTNGDREITEKVSEVFELTQLTKYGEVFHGNWYAKKSRPFMEEYGLWGKNAYEKRVPEQVMRGSRDMALGYLAGMLDTDGCTTHKPSPKKGKTIRFASWYSVSEQNMRDLHNLLASVGFNADVRIKKGSYRGEPYTSWEVVISNKMDLKRLAEELPVVRHRNVDNFRKFRDADQRGAFGDVNLDKVESVEPIGETVTIGIEVEDTHVHVTNGLVTHNTEFSALVAIMELHPDAPVRFTGYDPKAPGGLKPGRSVLSPFIPLLAPTKEQLTDLAYGVCMSVVPMLEDAGLFDPTMARILINGESESKIIPVAANAGRLDGLKPTFALVDETHRFYEDRQRAAYDTMVNNLAKRAMDDPWILTTTTAGDPNEPSVARDHHQDGILAHEGKKELTRSFFYHRQTSDENAKFDTMEERLVALKEASGSEVAAYRDLFSVAAEWDKSGNDVTYLERVWCNRWTQSSRTAFDKAAFEDLGDPSLIIEPGSAVTLGFDGAQTQDSTALIMTEIETGIQNPVGIWERPPEAESWRVPVSEVDAMVNYCMKNYDVELFYADPPYWQEYISKWSGEWEGTVVEWYTKNTNNMYYAIRNFDEAIDSGDLAHNSDSRYVRHVGNAGRNNLGVYDDEGKEKYRLGKLSRDRKFDAAMAGILSWQARLDAIKKGAEYVEQIQMPRRLR